MCIYNKTSKEYNNNVRRRFEHVKKYNIDVINITQNIFFYSYFYCIIIFGYLSFVSLDK